MVGKIRPYRRIKVTGHDIHQKPDFSSLLEMIEIGQTWFIIVKICQGHTSGRIKNMTLNLPLPDSIQKFINEQVAIGGYSNAAEYILHLIRQEQARAARVESLLLAGLDSGNSIEITDDWWEQKRAQLVQKLDRHQQ